MDPFFHESTHLSSESRIRIDDIIVSFADGPHQDLTDSSKLFAQVIVSTAIFAQTLPMDSAEDNNKSLSWNWKVKCKIPQDACYFYIAILREYPSNMTRALGKVHIERSEVIKKLKEGEAVSSPLIKVNSDGPELLVTVICSAIVPRPQSARFCLNIADDLQPLVHDYYYQQLSWTYEDTKARIEQMYHSSQLGEEVDELEISIMHERLLLVPDHGEAKAWLLDLLGKACAKQHEPWSPTVADLNHGLMILRDAVREAGENSQLTARDDLGICLLMRFEKLGEPADLEMAIQAFEDSVRLIPVDDPNRTSCLHNLGMSLRHRFNREGNVDDLNKSIQVVDEAIHLTPNEDPGKPGSLNNLALSLRDRFKRLGDLGDLTGSIRVLEDALLITPERHPNRPRLLDSLAGSLKLSFELLGDLGNLNRAIRIITDAINITPNGHPNKHRHLHTLGSLLRSHFLRVGDISYLEGSVQVIEEAILLRSDQPASASDHNNLGISLHVRFRYLGNLDDLESAIKAFEYATELMPNDHSHKAGCLSNLGYALMNRFQHVRYLPDIDRSIQLLEEAVGLTPDGDTTKAERLTNLGNSFQNRFEVYGSSQDRDAAILHYSLAAQAIIGHPQPKFQAAAYLVQHASHDLANHMEACTLAMNLIPQLAGFGSTVHDRHHQVTKAGSVARDAAATAIKTQHYDTAVEWLEQGRSVVWSQLLELRSPIDDLREVKPELADRLQSLSSQLEGSASHKVLDPEHPIDYHSLAYERQKLVEEIREIPGFERFLLPKKLPQLVCAANEGPIVMLNVSESRCDALVLRPGLDSVLHVPLPDLTVTDILKWHQGLDSLISEGTLTIRETDMRLKAIRVPDNGISFGREDGMAYILEKIWKFVAQPVLEALSITHPMDITSKIQRLWWCPTGALLFLPIHAAGVYPGGPKLSDFVVSSYTPTLTSLVNKSSTKQSEHPQLLIVALPSESGLPGAAKEVELISKHAGQLEVVSLLESQATRHNVAEALKASSWVHFACHGSQDPWNASRSCLSLANNTKLELSEIIELRLDAAELAFLSACETATGDKNFEEEAIHLAAGMLLAGYRGVIATLWTINDSIAPEVADETYRRLLKEYGGDTTRAAEALHFAIKKICEDWEKTRGRPLSFFSWVPFIHMGM